jgi:cell division protein FtsL
MKQIIKRLHGGIILGALAAVYVGFYLVQTIQHNYQLQQQISQLNGQISDMQTQNTTLKYQIQYYQTSNYQEEEARAKLGLQAPGEGVVLLPHSNTDTPLSSTPTPKAAPKTSNWQQWASFLEGHS